MHDPLIRTLAWGPCREVKSFRTYFVNDYKFHTVDWSRGLESYNSGVCVRGENGGLENDFYGILQDVIELSWTCDTRKKLVLFKCEWYDNRINRGMVVNNKYDLVEVNQSRRYNVAYDPFVFAHQADQVYYTSFPQGHQGWLSVMKVKPRGRIDAHVLHQPYQEEVIDEDNSQMEVEDSILDRDDLVDLNGEHEVVNIEDIIEKLAAPDDFEDNQQNDNDETQRFNEDDDSEDMFMDYETE